MKRPDGNTRTFPYPPCAQEAMTRAHALTGNRAEAIRYRQTAEKLGNSITGDEDRKIFLGDFNGGNWYGLIE